MRESRSNGRSTRQSRRAILAGGAAAAVGALAGCSSLPMIGDEEPTLGFDPETIPASFLEPFPSRPTTYPGPVPRELHGHHRQRAQNLLEEVPEDPSFPNGAVTNRLAEMRQRTAQDVREGPDEMESTPLERLSQWRRIRSEAAEVWGAYRAARGDVDADWLGSRRADVRRAALSFQRGWHYPGTDLVSAVAANRQFEDLLSSCHRYLEPRRPTPENPRAAVFTVGSLVRDVEHARSMLDDLQGLYDGYRESLPADSTTAYRETVAVAANRLEAVAQVSQRRVDRYASDDARPSDFERSIDDLPAEELFVETRQRVRWRRNELRDAVERGDSATAVVVSGQLTVAALALSTVVDAIRDGKYGMPDSLATVRDYRDTAVSALRQIPGLEPQRLAAVLGSSAWNPLQEVRYEFRERQAEGAPIERNGVVRMVATFALITHLARSVPEVTRRFDDELSAFAR